MMSHSNTVLRSFAEHAERGPSRVAISHLGRQATYGDLNLAARRFAGYLLENGVRRGDRVMLLLANSINYVVCWLGVQYAGAIVVAINPETTHEELQLLIADCSPRAIVANQRSATTLARLSQPELLIVGTGESARRERFSTTCLEEIIAGSWHSAARNVPWNIRESELAQIIYTSGTTGRPKGVMLTHGNLAANCQSIVSYLGLTPQSSMLVTLPFFYSYGNSLLFTHLAVGGRLVLSRDAVYWNRVLDLLEQERVVGFAGVPSTFGMLLHRSNFCTRDLTDLSYMTCAGGALAAPVVARIRRAVPHVRLFLMYGQTEATARLSTLMPDELDQKPGSIGRGIPGVRLSVLDDANNPVAPGEVGEIVAQGANVMAGYWNDPAATAEVIRPEGLRTGDLARVDEDGYIYIVGRKSDLIKVGSYRIHPREIEEVILQLDGIADVAVVGQPHDVWGEIPVAYVLPSETCECPSESRIVEHCRRHLPRFKVIHAVHFVKELPRTASGKVRRSVLRELASATGATGAQG